MLTHDYAMTAALAAVGRRPRTDIALLSPVEIGDNCFLGAGVIVLPGTRVGKNAIVGAGAVVTGEVPENSVVAGNPARTICTIEEWLRRKQSLPENVRKHEDKY